MPTPPSIAARRTRAALLGIACALAGLGTSHPVAADTPARRAPVVDDLYRIATVSDPQLSPDGERVAYVVSTSSRERDADETDLWIVGWSGGPARQLTFTSASEHSPRWSPDGRKLAFLSDRGDTEAGDQIWVLDLDGGEAVQRTRHATPITAFAWSPDGERFVATALSPAAAASPAAPALREPAPVVIDRLQFKRDVDGWLGEQRSQILLLDAATGAASALTDARSDAVQPAWSPDGRTLVFLTRGGADPDAHDDWNLYAIEARAGATARALTTHPGTDGDPWLDWLSGPPRFSPNGREVAYLRGGDPADLWYGLLQVGVVGVDGRNERNLTATLDRNALDPRWSRDGRWLYFRLEDDGGMQLARVAVTSAPGAARIERLSPAEFVAAEFDVGPAGRAVVVATAVDQPTELAAVTRGGLRWLTRHNQAWKESVTLVAASAVAAAVPGGAGDVHALLLEPSGPRPSRGWPTLLRLHGGPVSQHQNEFDLAWQLFAAAGYAVVAPNPRGSTGRGYAWQKALFARWGDVDVQDVLALTDHLVERGLADPERLGVGGWSYGSILTNYVIASTPRFRAATSGAGIANMLAGYGTDQYQREYEAELGLPWRNADTWLKLSYPFMHADRIRTPTLFLGGSEDFNVPLHGSEQMYQALRRQGVPTRLVIYPGQHHGFDRPTLRADRLHRYLDWYAQHLPAAAVPVAPERESIAIHCGRLIDGMSADVRRDVTVVIRDGRVEHIGAPREADAALPRLHLPEHTCLPGLIDLHTHLTELSGDTADLTVYFRRKRDEQLAISRDNAAVTLRAGFTAARNVGAYVQGTDTEMRDAINRGDYPGPRMQVSSYYLTIPGGGGDLLVPGVPEADIPANVRGGIARGPEQFRAKAERALANGADLLKVIASGAVLAYGGVPGAPEMNAAEIRAVVDAAHARGKRVAAHAHGPESIRAAIEAGVDTIEHASLIDAAGLKLARERGVALAMDVYNGDYIDTEGRKQGWPEEFLRKNFETTEAQRQNFTSAVRQGVDVVYATDAGVFPHGLNARQFRIMVERGMTPMQAIQSATSRAARAMGWQDRIGALRPGLFGDLIAVRGDPLADITLLERVDVVVKGGHAYRQGDGEALRMPR